MIKYLHKFALFLIALVAFCLDGSALERRSVRFNFRLADASVVPSYNGNSQSLRDLDHFIENGGEPLIVHNVVISGYASPEGRSEYNDALARLRARSIADLLMQRYDGFDEQLIEIVVNTPNWQEMARLVARDSQCSERGPIIMLANQTMASNEKLQALRELLIPSLYQYLKKHIFPDLRYVDLSITYGDDAASLAAADKSATDLSSKSKFKEAADQFIPTVQESPSLMALASPTEQPVAPEPQRDSVSSVESEFNRVSTRKVRVLTKPDYHSYQYDKRPLFALKTNLLFDAATLLNVELEVPIGKRWSLAAEWIFPWWLWDNSQHCLQMMSGNIEARYWFSPLVNRRGDEREALTGWFAGIYAGGGLYDFEYARKGYQGEFFVAAGISAGFAHRIGRNLRMEYSLGVGYMQTNYRSYEAQKGSDDAWHLIRQQTGNYTWIGPTRAKVSLVWMLNRRVKQSI